MSDITMADVVAASYTMSEENLQYLPSATKKNTALLLIDIQQLAAPEYMAEKAIAAGLDPAKVQDALTDYRQRFESSLSNAQSVLGAARKNGIPAIHVKIESKTTGGRDRMLGHKLVGWEYSPGSKGARFLDACKPEPGEAVFTKTNSGAFTGTGLDQTLRNMGIEILYLVGFATDECVETTFRVAVDHGYMATIISDATTTYYAESHQHVIDKFTSWGMVNTTDQVVQILDSLPES